MSPHFSQALQYISDHLESNTDLAPVTDLGNDVTASMSVPSAIYAFLRVRQGPVKGIEGNQFEK